MEKVQKTLLDLVEDSKPLRKQASTLLQFAAVFMLAQAAETVLAVRHIKQG